MNYHEQFQILKELPVRRNWMTKVMNAAVNISQKEGVIVEPVFGLIFEKCTFDIKFYADQCQFFECTFKGGIQAHYSTFWSCSFSGFSVCHNCELDICKGVVEKLVRSQVRSSQLISHRIFQSLFDTSRIQLGGEEFEKHCVFQESELSRRSHAP